IKLHLKPLAIAANIIQSAFCWLDEVLITFSHLLCAYQMLPMDSQDTEACNMIIWSLKSRWAKANQQVFIAAVILNPFFRLNLFQKTTYFTYGAIDTLLSDLWTHFFGDPAPIQLCNDIQAYLNNSGPQFGSFNRCCNDLHHAADGLKTSPDPLRVWEDAVIPRERPNGLYWLALHILSIYANLASCKCLFSTLGLILTKLWICLSNKCLLGLAKL
ncbi:hypothetical protein P691DRAFT_625249, partial [Macrolepiota fuliginosa MF-IS2]